MAAPSGGGAPGGRAPGGLGGKLAGGLQGEDWQRETMAALEATPKPLVILLEFSGVFIVTLVGLGLARWVLSFVAFLRPILAVVFGLVALKTACQSWLVARKGGKSMLHILFCTDIPILSAVWLGLVSPEGSAITTVRVSCFSGIMGVFIAASNREILNRQLHGPKPQPSRAPVPGPPFCEVCGLYLTWKERSLIPWVGPATVP